MSAVSSESPLAAADLSAPSAHPSSPTQPAESAEPGAAPASADFGPNEWLVDELYERYLNDPGSVDKAWWSFFADYRPVRGSGNGTGPQPVADRGRPRRPPPRRRPRRRGGARAAARRSRPAASSREPGGRRAAGRRRREQAPRRRRPHRAEHGGQPRRAHRHERPRRARQAAHRQPDRHQQPPAARAGREDLLHPPDRLRGGPGGQGAPRDERLVRRGRRQAGPRHAASREPRPGHRPQGQGRQPPAARAQHQGRRGDGLPPVLDGVRGRGPQGAQRQADGRRLPGHHDLPHQPGHDRHRALRAAPHAGPGRDRRRRRHGVPRRLPGRERGDHGQARDQQDGDADFHVRPPDHPGRAVRRLPAGRAPAAARRGRLLRPRSSRASASPTSRCAGSRTSRTGTRTTSPARPASRSSSTPTGSAAT